MPANYYSAQYCYVLPIVKFEPVNESWADSRVVLFTIDTSFFNTDKAALVHLQLCIVICYFHIIIFNVIHA